MLQLWNHTRRAKVSHMAFTAPDSKSFTGVLCHYKRREKNVHYLGKWLTDIFCFRSFLHFNADYFFYVSFLCVVLNLNKQVFNGSVEMFVENSAVWPLNENKQVQLTTLQVDGPTFVLTFDMNSKELQQSCSRQECSHWAATYFHWMGLCPFTTQRIVQQQIRSHWWPRYQQSVPSGSPEIIWN